jgi:hypothetical protein
MICQSPKVAFSYSLQPYCIVKLTKIYKLCAIQEAQCAILTAQTNNNDLLTVLLPTFIKQLILVEDEVIIYRCMCHS